jgi:hypothetical protein
LQAAEEAKKLAPENSIPIVRALNWLADRHRVPSITRGYATFSEAEGFTDVRRNSEEWAALQDAIADLMFAEAIR